MTILYPNNKQNEQEQAPAAVSLEALYEKYADMVYRIAFLRTKNAGDADDIMQEVFLRYMRRQPSCRDEQHQKAWLIRAAINRSNSLLTSAWKRRTEQETALEASVQPAQESDVYAAVAQLPIKQRTAVHLYYYEGYSVAETAELMGAGQSAVKTWLYRAREKLRIMLEE